MAQRGREKSNVLLTGAPGGPGYPIAPLPYGDSAITYDFFLARAAVQRTTRKVNVVTTFQIAHRTLNCLRKKPFISKTKKLNKAPSKAAVE